MRQTDRASVFSVRDPMTLAVVLGLVALAALIRAPGLGVWGFAVDEFYFSQAISFVQEVGLPRFPDGGYYQRGIAVQYLAAIPATLLDNREAAVRLVPLLCGLATIPLFYRVCRQYLSALSASLCTLIVVLSSWHVEFSRFARMYSPFQFLFLAFVFFLYSGYWLKNRSHQIASWIIALVAVFVYEGSIFLPCLLALPLLQDARPRLKKTIELVVVTGALLGVNYLMHKLPFRWIGVEHAFPAEYLSSGTPRRGPVHLPYLDLFHAVRSSALLTVGYGVLVCGGIFVILRQLRGKRDLRIALAVVLAALLPLVHQFGLLAAILLLFLLVRRESLAFLVGSWKIWSGYVAAAALFWSALALVARESWLPGAGALGIAKKTVIQLFLYPRVHQTVVAPIAESVPLWGLLALAAIGVSILGHLLLPRRESRALPLAVVLVCLMLLGTLRTTYISSRYSFFVFPLVLLLAHIEIDALMCWCEGRLGSVPRRALAFVPLALFCLTDDFQPRHLLNVASEQANFRTGPFRGLADHWYDRKDFRSPARFVNGVYESGDEVVIDYAPASADLDMPFSNYVPIGSKRFGDITRKRGTEECWTGRPLIHDVWLLFDRVPRDPARSLWLIAVRTRGGGGGIQDLESFVAAAGERGVVVSEESQGIDGSVGVWRLARRVGRP